MQLKVNAAEIDARGAFTGLVQGVRTLPPLFTSPLLSCAFVMFLLQPLA